MMKTFKTSKLGLRPRSNLRDVTAGVVYPLLGIGLYQGDSARAVILDDIGDMYFVSDQFIDEHFDWVVLS